MEGINLCYAPNPHYTNFPSVQSKSHASRGLIFRIIYDELDLQLTGF